MRRMGGVSIGMGYSEARTAPFCSSLFAFQWCRSMFSPTATVDTVRNDGSIAAALRIQVLTHHIQVGHIARQHALQRGMTAKQRRLIRFVQPRIGLLRI